MDENNLTFGYFIYRFYPIASPNVWHKLMHFDEHSLNCSYKFGVVYQRKKQTKEEEVFGNREESPAFQEFLNFLGDSVNLQVVTCEKFS